VNQIKSIGTIYVIREYVNTRYMGGFEIVWNVSPCSCSCGCSQSL